MTNFAGKYSKGDTLTAPGVVETFVSSGVEPAHCTPTITTMTAQSGAKKRVLSFIVTSICYGRRAPPCGNHSPHPPRLSRRNVTQPECVKCTLFGALGGFGAFARRAVLAVLLCAGLAAHADPYEFEDTGARDPDFAAGKVAMEKKDWKEAVKRFHQTALREPDNADVHNFLGFAYRNLQQLDVAFKHYKRAIELNPRHRGAHEYIGEAYLIVNDLPNAEKHLAALREICLLPCEELADLEKAVRQYRVKPRR
jgi:hypothetical protein